MDILSVIGSIASVLSIPLAVYFFIKANEDKVNKVKRDIINTLLKQLLDANALERRDIITVINSECRNNKIKSSSITETEIIEDMITTIMKSLFINQERKNDLIRILHFQPHINIGIVHMNQLKSTELLVENENVSKNDKKYFSEDYKTILSIVIGLTIVTIGGIQIIFENYVKIEILKLDDFGTFLLSSITVSFITLLLTFSLNTARKAKKAKKVMKEEDEEESST